MNAKEYYIYVIKNTANYIKIGRTTNFEKRLHSLSGSNGGGEKIEYFYVTPPTACRTLETVMHEHFRNYRIPDTEWFTGITFQEVVTYLLGVIHSKEFQHCNEQRYLYPYETEKKEFESELEPELE